MTPAPHEQPTTPGGGKPATLIVMIVLAMIAAAVALAFAGWDPAAIVGLLAAVAAIVTPLVANAIKSDQNHVMLNQRTTDMMRQLELQRGELQGRGIPIPTDPSLHRPPRHGA